MEALVVYSRGWCMCVVVNFNSCVWANIYMHTGITAQWDCVLLSVEEISQINDTKTKHTL
jgi:hypothetical protein